MAIQSDESVHGIRSWPIRLHLLLAMHFVVTLLATWTASASPDEPQAIIAMAVLEAQSCLLAVWLALGRASLLCRSTLVFMGVICLAALLAFAVWYANGRGSPFANFLPVSLSLVAVPTLGTAGSLLVMRQQKAGLQLIAAHDRAPVSEGLQFNVRHLLLLMTFVAILLGVGRVARSYLGGTVVPFRTVILVGLISLCWIAATLAIVWAAFGVRRPHERMAVAIVLSLFAGLLFPFFQGVPWGLWRVLWRAPAGAVTVAMIIACSLLVVRSLGYRLIRIPEGTVR